MAEKRLVVIASLTILTFLLSTSACIASGWNDYSLGIGDGYNIFRCNSMDVCIGKADGGLILYPDEYDRHQTTLPLPTGQLSFVPD